MIQAGKRSAARWTIRTRVAVAVLGHKQHRHQDPVGLRQMQRLPIRLATLSITLIRAALRSAGDFNDR
jgi:hypothetical protein